MSYELYNILGVTPDASEDEIKRAYFKKVRQFPPEKNPEKFKAIRTAYETLINKESRADYDALQKYGGKISKLILEAEDFMSKEDWNEAVKKWKAVLDLLPDNKSVYESLAMCYLMSGDIDKSIELYKKLLKRDSTIPTYWMNLGWAYLIKARENTLDKDEFYKKSEKAFKKVTELEPYNALAYQALATIKQDKQEWEEAVKLLELAVSSDNKLDLHDVFSLFQLCPLYIILDKEKEFKDTLKRIESIVPDDEEVKEIVAFKLVALADELINPASRYKEAYFVLRLASKLLPNNNDIKKAKDEAKTIYKATEELGAFETDAFIIQPFKFLLAASLFEVYHESYDKSAVELALKRLEYYSPWELQESIDRIKEVYPNLYKLNKPFLKELSQFISKEYTEPNQPIERQVTTSNTTSYSNTSSTYSNKSSDWGCGEICGTALCCGIGILIASLLGC